MEPQCDGQKSKYDEFRSVHPLVASAPSRHSLFHDSQYLQQGEQRPVSTDSKYKLTITSERFAQLKKIVEDAVRDHRTFTVKGM